MRGPDSAEHIISELVIRVLMADGIFSISGLPWQAQAKKNSRRRKIFGRTVFASNTTARFILLTTRPNIFSPRSNHT